MQFFIANCTQQNHIINCLPLEHKKVLTRSVPAGRQVSMGDFTDPQINSIVAQLGVYGLVTVDEAVKSRKVVPYVYSTGKPVKADSIMKIITKNRGVLLDDGRQRRQHAAVAAAAAINEMSPTQALEMSVEEEKPAQAMDSSGAPLSNDAPIGEGFRIYNGDGDAPPRSPNRKRAA